MTATTLLDGPLGTELARRGVSTALPLWSASALSEAPEVISAIHRDYAAAGASVHTANTFRTTQRAMGDGWQKAAELAVRLAREAVPTGHRVAGSIAPLEDCYRPDLSPGGGGEVVVEHAALAQVLADAGCDLLLCETFPREDEAIAAVRAAVRTGVPTWASLTAGYRVNLMTPVQMAVVARRVVDAGASAVLVNCTPTGATLGYVQALESAHLGVPIGAYANGGSANHTDGFTPRPGAPQAYLQAARQWLEYGASVLGSCCGTGPEHIRALSEL